MKAMFRLLFLILLITVIAVVAEWFINNDGSIVVEWMGYEIKTSITVTIAFLFVSFLILFAVIQLFITIKNAPANYQKSVKDKKKEKGLTAITEGFAAIAAGDAKQAKKLTKQAVGCLGHVPATKLLSAQSAQLEGNMGEAKVHYTAMLENKETEMIAIKGLLLQAEKDGDLEYAISLAEKAVKSQPNSDWANKVLLRLYKLTKRWKAAHTLTGQLAKLKLITKEKATRDMAVILLAQSNEEKEKGDNVKALEHAQKAYKELTNFAPAAVIYSQILMAANSKNKRKALNALEKSWKTEPNPLIAKAYMDLYAGESPEKRQKYADKLLKLKPNDVNSHIVVAKAAIETENASKARNHLKMALNIKETVDTCNLIAQVERMEEADEEVVNKWLQRAQTAIPDVIWGCKKCSASQTEWQTNCDNCGSFDSLRWAENKAGMNIVNPSEKLAITDENTIK